MRQDPLIQEKANAEDDFYSNELERIQAYLEKKQNKSFGRFLAQDVMAQSQNSNNSANAMQLQNSMYLKKQMKQDQQSHQLSGYDLYLQELARIQAMLDQNEGTYGG